MNSPLGYVQAARDFILREYARSTLEAAERAEDARRRIAPAEIIALVAYLIALLVSHLWLPHLQSSVARVLVALLPLPPIVLIVMLSVRRVLVLDELQRRIELVALAVVATTTWLGLLACWLLQHAGMSRPPLSLALLAMVLIYNLARRWAQRHYA